MLIGHADLAVSEPLLLAPGDILRDGSALLLGQGRHDGDQQLALAVQGVDVLLFKVDFHTFFLQFPDGGEAVHSIPGKATHTLGHDRVDPARQGIGNHPVEAFTVLRADTGDALIGVHIHELLVGIALDVTGVVIHLRSVAGELLIAVGENSGISRYPPFHIDALGSTCVEVQRGGDHGHIFCFRHTLPSFLWFSLRWQHASPVSNWRLWSGLATA